MNKHDGQRFHVYIRGILLIGFTLLMMKLVLTGNMTNFIAPKMLPFSYFAIVVFLLLGVLQIWRSGSKKHDIHCDCGDLHERPSAFRSFFVYLVFIIPIVTGFLFPDIVLDSSVAAKRGFKSSLAQNGQTENSAEIYVEELDESVGGRIAESTNIPDVPLEHPEGFEIQERPEGFYEELKSDMLQAQTITFTEENYIAMTTILDQSPEEFVGQEVEMVGFVYREDNFEKDQFVVARFGLSCCVADASVYGTLVTVPNGEEYGDDLWVKVKGEITTTNYEDWTLPYVKVNKIEKIKQPKEPYVYEAY
ncbi:TIGR03943 family putative permease subunit [Metabacillus malikii]|uniref:Membrane protein n=1 Tax=Metabacillus malikii TaxID=1504265 RepID=A0ABT9ZFR9_9BACI|nr:TIGR03943 family protein [Metabacillus malikii]MDQ0231129.1 putative membrane protein [Metabacillus malikii]